MTKSVKNKKPRKSAKKVAKVKPGRREPTNTFNDFWTTAQAEGVANARADMRIENLMQNHETELINWGEKSKKIGKAMGIIEGIRYADEPLRIIGGYEKAKDLIGWKIQMDKASVKNVENMGVDLSVFGHLINKEKQKNARVNTTIYTFLGKHDTAKEAYKDLRDELAIKYNFFDHYSRGQEKAHALKAKNTDGLPNYDWNSEPTKNIKAWSDTILGTKLRIIPPLYRKNNASGGEDTLDIIHDAIPEIEKAKLKVDDILKNAELDLKTLNIKPNTINTPTLMRKGRQLVNETRNFTKDVINYKKNKMKMKIEPQDNLPVLTDKDLFDLGLMDDMNIKTEYDDVVE